MKNVNAPEAGIRKACPGVTAANFGCRERGVPGDSRRPASPGVRWVHGSSQDPQPPR